MDGMRRRYLLPHLVCFLVCFFIGGDGSPRGGSAAAAPLQRLVASGTNTPDDDDAEDRVTTAAGDRDPLADRLHRSISRRVLNTAESIDAFFYAAQTEIEENRTTFKVQLGVFGEAEQEVRLDTGTRLKLVLPGFQDRLHLVLAGDPEDDDEVLGETLDGAPEAEMAAEETDGITAAVRYFLMDSLNRNLSFSAGVRIRDTRLVGFPEARYRRTFDVGDRALALRFEQRVAWFTDEGWRETSRCDLDVLSDRRYLWRTTVEGVWAEETDGYRYDLRQALFQPLKWRAALRYEWINAFNTCTDGQLEEIIFKVRYRQSFLRPWLFFEIAPQLSFPEAEEFEATPGILVRVETLFGHYNAPIEE